MGRYVTVSVRMRRELLEEARRLNINTSELIRCTLENEVRRHRLILLEERLKGKRKSLIRSTLKILLDLFGRIEKLDE